MSIDSWNVEVFYDGECPLCTREINMLRKLDKKNGIRFTDIMASDFDAASFGKTSDDFMREIQGRLPDGTWLTGVDVFRHLYSNTSFRWLVPLTRLPIAKQVLNFSYKIFAKNRLKLTGRCEKDGECKIKK